MSNAEQRAFERYPDYREMDGECVTQIHKRKVFAEGYHQAEEDNKLSWKDIEKICLIAKEVHQFRGFWSESVYQEVLKRFNKGMRNK